MDTNEDDVLNKLLDYCTAQNKLIYNVNEFLVAKSFYNTYPTAILNTLANSKSLFDVDKNIFQISIKVFLFNKIN